MDGNGRWAKKRLLPRIAGHKKGLDSIQVIIKLAINYNISTATLYAFSTENWNRPSEEINGLMDLFSDSIKSQTDKIIKNGKDGFIKYTSKPETMIVLINKILRNYEFFSRNSYLRSFKFDVNRACEKLWKRIEIENNNFR